MVASVLVSVRTRGMCLARRSFRYVSLSGAKALGFYKHIPDKYLKGVERYGVDRRGTESVEASLQGRYMHRSLGHRLYRGITPESNRLPQGEYFVENVVFITYLDKTIVAEKIASGEIVVVQGSLID